MNPGLPEAVTRLSNVGNQLIRWPCFAKSLHLCWYMNSCMSDTAIQLSWQRLPPSDNGVANRAGEEQTDLLRNTWHASVHVQRWTWLSATFTALVLVTAQGTWSCLRLRGFAQRTCMVNSFLEWCDLNRTGVLEWCNLNRTGVGHSAGDLKLPTSRGFCTLCTFGAWRRQKRTYAKKRTKWKICLLSLCVQPKRSQPV